MLFSALSSHLPHACVLCRHICLSVKWDNLQSTVDTHSCQSLEPWNLPQDFCPVNAFSLDETCVAIHHYIISSYLQNHRCCDIIITRVKYFSVEEYFSYFTHVLSTIIDQKSASWLSMKANEYIILCLRLLGESAIYRSYIMHKHIGN